jgi:hypothetical protein
MSFIKDQLKKSLVIMINSKSKIITPLDKEEEEKWDKLEKKYE